MPKKLPTNKDKNIRAFLSEEEGEVTKESVKKIGLGVIAAGIALSGLMYTEETFASYECAESYVEHSSHQSHGSHGSHGSHAQW